MSSRRLNPRLADTWLLLSWKKLLLIPAAWLACVIWHNVIYALFQPFFEPDGDEPFFFLLAVVVIPAYALACVVYSLIRWAGKYMAKSRAR